MEKIVKLADTAVVRQEEHQVLVLLEVALDQVGTSELVVTQQMMEAVAEAGWYGACPAGGSTTAYTSNSTSDTSGSPGGSGYVFTSSTLSQYPSGRVIDTAYYLANARTVGGGSSFPSTSGSTENGHEGNGYARITVSE